jgi:hypothetical protein
LKYRSGSSSNASQDAQRALRYSERTARELDDPSRRRLPAQHASTSTSYSHLPADLRAQLEALPPLLSPVQRPRRVNRRIIQSVSVPQTVAELQIQAAALPSLSNSVPPSSVPHTPGQLYVQVAALQVIYLFYICQFDLTYYLL